MGCDGLGPSRLSSHDCSFRRNMSAPPAEVHGSNLGPCEAKANEGAMAANEGARPTQCWNPFCQTWHSHCRHPPEEKKGKGKLVLIRPCPGTCHMAETPEVIQGSHTLLGCVLSAPCLQRIQSSTHPEASTCASSICRGSSECKSSQKGADGCAMSSCFQLCECTSQA